jgi:hypothetical protein
MKGIQKINVMALGVVGLSAVLVMGVSALGSASAATLSETETVTVKIDDNLSLILTQPTGDKDPGNIVADPESGTPATGFSDIYLATNNATGASLTLSMVSTDTHSGALASAVAANTATINRLTGDGSAIGTNQWAYRFFNITSLVNGSYDIDTTDVSSLDVAAAGAGYWKAVPDYGSGLDIWTAVNFDTGDARTVRNIFGAVVDNTLPADNYTNDVVYTASTNPAP